MMKRLLLAMLLVCALPISAREHDYSGAWIHPAIPATKELALPPITLIRANQLSLSDAFPFTGAVSISAAGSLTVNGTGTFAGALTATAGPVLVNTKIQNAVQFADQYSTTGTVTAPVNAPAIFQATSGGTVAANNYKCEVTFVGATSGETTASPASTSATTTGAASLLTCSHAEIPPPAGALTYNVYWQTAGAGSFFQGHTGVALGIVDQQTTTPPTSGSTPPGSNTALAVLPTVQTALGGAGTMVIPSTVSSSAGAAGAPTQGETILDYRNGISFSNPANNKGNFISAAGLFNNTQEDFSSVSINKCNARATFNTLFSPTSFASEGFSSCITTPSTSTSGQINGIAGYAIDQRSNPVTPTVGVFGVGDAQASNARVWGANFVGTDVGSASSSSNIYGGENDCFITIAASVCRGLLLEAFWFGGIQPTAAYGIEVGQPQGAVANPQWTYGLRFDLGATATVTGNNAAILFDRVATGNSQNSQGIQFQSTNSGGGNPIGTLFQLPAGDLQFTPNTASGFVCNTCANIRPGTVNATDLGTTALPFVNLWLGTAATNNFKFQPATTAAARTVAMPDPLANVSLGFSYNATNPVYQTKRGVAGCTTAASIGGTCATDITVTWGTAFPDANYSVTCTGSTPTAVPAAPFVVSATKLAATVHINYFAITAVAASYATIDCIGVHD